MASVALALAGCGGSDGPITDKGECEDALADRYEAGDLALENGGASLDASEVSDAVPDTTGEFCNDVELAEGVEIDDIDSQAKADLANRLR